MDFIFYNNYLVNEMKNYTKIKIRECMDVILYKIELEIINKNYTDSQSREVLSHINTQYNVYFKCIINTFLDCNFPIIIEKYIKHNNNIFLETLDVINFMFETLGGMFKELKKNTDNNFEFDIHYCYDVLIDFCSKITLP